MKQGVFFDILFFLSLIWGIVPFTGLVAFTIVLVRSISHRRQKNPFNLNKVLSLFSKIAWWTPFLYIASLEGPVTLISAPAFNPLVDIIVILFCQLLSPPASICGIYFSWVMEKISDEGRNTPGAQAGAFFSYVILLVPAYFIYLFLLALITPDLRNFS